MSVTKQWPSQGVVNVTPTSYPIPQAGDLNWASLTDFLVALANGAQATTFQRYANRTATVSPVLLSANDCIVNTNLTIPGPVAITLPAGVDKQVYYIADNKFDAATNPITITPNGIETIGGAATFVLNSNGESVMLAFQSNTLNWNVAANAKPNPSGGSVGGFTPNISIISDGSGNLTSSTTSATEIGYVSGATSSIQTQLNNKQPLDGDLTAIAALPGTGLATRTAADTWTTRTLTAGSTKISITNGDGVAGDPFIDAVEANFSLNNIGGVLAVGKGGTGVTSVTTVPASVAWAGWDVNFNMSANSFIPKFSSTATAGGTTVLTVASTQLQYFTGTLAQTVTLPVASTLVVGQAFHVVNRSTQNVTVQSSGANTVQVMAGDSFATFTCVIASGTTAASWNVEYSVATAGTVTSVNVSGGTTGLTTSGGPVTTTGTITLAGTLIVANGGTGLTGGTSGGIPGYTSTSTIASSVLLTADQLVVGGGAGATPKPLAAGTNGQILRMNSGPIPAWYSVPRPSTQAFTSGSSTYIPSFTFFVSSANATVGATYTNNGFTFTVSQTIASGLILVCVGTGSPAASGTLTKSGGTGDATITFTSSVQPVWLRVVMVGGGAGGQGGGSTAGTAATVGGATTFGTSLLTANGGGVTAWGGTVGAGATATINLPAYGAAKVGSIAAGGSNGTNAVANVGGSNGGVSPFGGNGSGGGVGSAASAAAANSGSGGGGGASGAGTNPVSGAGGGAGGYIDAIVPVLSASYSVAIGAAGSAGGAGGTGSAGGAGGSGYVIVYENYI